MVGFRFTMVDFGFKMVDFSVKMVSFSTQQKGTHKILFFFVERALIPS